MRRRSARSRSTNMTRPARMSDRRFVPTATPIDGLMGGQRSRVEDERGFLSRIYCEELEDIGFVDPVVQINHTVTRLRGTVRGLHFQLPPHTDDKLVTCLRGEIFDVAVDLRAMSPTHLQWHGE